MNSLAYIEFTKEHEELPVFFQPWYLDVTCQNQRWNVCLSHNSSGEIRGVLVYFLKKKFNLKYITQPPLTPFLGPYVIYPKTSLKNTTKYSYEKEVYKELIQQLPTSSLLTNVHFLPSIKNGLPFIWAGFDLHVRYTYRIDQKQIHNLKKNLDSKQRNIIENAQSKFLVKESNDSRLFYSIVEESFKRKNIQTPYSFDLFNKLHQECKENDACKLYLAYDHKDNAHAGVFVVYDQKITYCLITGQRTVEKRHNAISYLLFKVIENSLKEREIFDFEGSMLPKVEKFFRSFGGTQTPYLHLKKYRNQFSKVFLQSINR